MRPASGRQMQNVFTIWRDSWTILYPDVRPRTEYISRRNNAAAYLHWSICKDHGIEITDKWYQHEPETVMHSKDNNITPLWDMSVNTDRAITANRPDIVVKDSVNSPYKLIDITVPLDWNVVLKEKKKKSKYKDLEINKYRECDLWKPWWSLWLLVRLVHVKNGMVENIKKVSESAVTEIQKICKLGSAQILRKVLSVWAEWLTWVTDALGAWFAPSWCTKRTPITIIIMWTHCAMLRPLREQLQLKKIPQRAVRGSEWREVSTL